MAEPRFLVWQRATHTGRLSASLYHGELPRPDSEAHRTIALAHTVAAAHAVLALDALAALPCYAPPPAAAAPAVPIVRAG